MSTISGYASSMSTKSEDILRAWGAFFVAHALSVQRIERALSAETPLSLHEYDLLLTIDRSLEKRIRYSALASASLYTKSGITRILKRLESRGYIEREKCESDARGAYASLTSKGKDAMKKTWSVYSREILGIFDPALTQADARLLERLMGRVIDELEEYSLVQIGAKKPT